MKQIVTETKQIQIEFYQRLIQNLFISILTQVKHGRG